jgi:hypothetical protein
MCPFNNRLSLWIIREASDRNNVPFLQNCLNWRPVYAGPLSVLSLEGTPTTAKHCNREAMMAQPFSLH